MKIKIETKETNPRELSMKKQWMIGETDDFTYSLSMAVPGSTVYLVLKEKESGKTIKEEFTLADIFQQWLNAKMEEQEEE